MPLDTTRSVRLTSGQISTLRIGCQGPQVSLLRDLGTKNGPAKPACNPPSSAQRPIITPCHPERSGLGPHGRVIVRGVSGAEGSAFDKMRGCSGPPVRLSFSRTKNIPLNFAYNFDLRAHNEYMRFSSSCSRSKTPHEKPTNPCNSFAERILRVRPMARGFYIDGLF